MRLHAVPGRARRGHAEIEIEGVAVAPGDRVAAEMAVVANERRQIAHGLAQIDRSGRERAGQLRAHLVAAPGKRALVVRAVEREAQRTEIDSRLAHFRSGVERRWPERERQGESAAEHARNIAHGRGRGDDATFELRARATRGRSIGGELQRGRFEVERQSSRIAAQEIGGARDPNRKRAALAAPGRLAVESRRGGHSAPVERRVDVLQAVDDFGAASQDSLAIDEGDNSQARGVRLGGFGRRRFRLGCTDGGAGGSHGAAIDIDRHARTDEFGAVELEAAGEQRQPADRPVMRSASITSAPRGSTNEILSKLMLGRGSREKVDGPVVKT